MSQNVQGPWHVKFAYAFGIPAVIAMYMVYFQTDKLDKSQTDVNKQVVQLSAEIRSLREIISRDSLDRELIERKYDRLMNMMVRVCATTAETNIDKNSCFEYAGTQGTAGDEINMLKKPPESFVPEKLRRY